jgi:hypothetical protein
MTFEEFAQEAVEFVCRQPNPRRATLTRYRAAFICGPMIRSSAIIAAEKRRRRAKTARARA